MLRSILIFAIILMFASLMGCSGGDISPADPPVDDYGFSPKSTDSQAGHLLWGVYDLFIDTEAMTVEAVLLRSGDKHYDVTKYVIPPECDDCVVLELKNFDSVSRIATVDVTLRNPYPISGYDVRGILFYNDAGHDLVFHDGYVSIFDDGIPPYFNPFMRYGKDNPYGEFPGNAELKRTYKVRIPQPPQYDAIQFAIDAFRPKDGFREPYQIANKMVEGMLYSDGANSAVLYCKVLDRNDDVLKVTIECPDLFDGFIDLVHVGDTWSAQFSNDNLAPAEATPYLITIEAYDPVASYTLRDTYPVYVMDPPTGWIPDMKMVEISTCTYDIAGKTSGFEQHGAYLADPMSGCMAFNSFDMTFMMPMPALSLQFMNPKNMSLQPYPPVRMDSAAGGGIAFSNSSAETFIDGLYSLPMNQVVVTVDGDMLFSDDGLGSDQAHYPLYADTLAVADVCGGFESRFYMLWAETVGEDLPVFKCYEANFTTKQQIIGTTIPAEFIGLGSGLIANDVTKILGIDVMEVEDSPPIENVELYILEKTTDGSDIEVFNIYTNPATQVSEVTYKMSIQMSDDQGEALDIELLPPNPDYPANPDIANIVVLRKYDYGGVPGGYAEIYSTIDGTLVDAIGTVMEPLFLENLKYVDVIDANFTIAATAQMSEGGGMGGIMMVFLYHWV